MDGHPVFHLLSVRLAGSVSPDWHSWSWSSDFAGWTVLWVIYAKLSSFNLSLFLPLFHVTDQSSFHFSLLDLLRTVLNKMDGIGLGLLIMICNVISLCH